MSNNPGKAGAALRASRPDTHLLRGGESSRVGHFIGDLQGGAPHVQDPNCSFTNQGLSLVPQCYSDHRILFCNPQQRVSEGQGLGHHLLPSTITPCSSFVGLLHPCKQPWGSPVGQHVLALEAGCPPAF